MDWFRWARQMVKAMGWLEAVRRWCEIRVLLEWTIIERNFDVRRALAGDQSRLLERPTKERSARCDRIIHLAGLVPGWDVLGQAVYRLWRPDLCVGAGRPGSQVLHAMRRISQPDLRFYVTGNARRVLRCLLVEPEAVSLLAAWPPPDGLWN